MRNAPYEVGAAGAARQWEAAHAGPPRRPASAVLPTMSPAWASMAALVLLAALAPLPSAAAGPRRLIEMGWDEPDPSFMRRHLDQLEPKY